jgi:hypothetical protein
VGNPRARFERGGQEPGLARAPHLTPTNDTPIAGTYPWAVGHKTVARRAEYQPWLPLCFQLPAGRAFLSVLAGTLRTGGFRQLRAGRFHHLVAHPTHLGDGPAAQLRELPQGDLHAAPLVGVRPTVPTERVGAERMLERFRSSSRAHFRLDRPRAVLASSQNPMPSITQPAFRLGGVPNTTGTESRGPRAARSLTVRVAPSSWSPRGCPQRVPRVSVVRDRPSAVLGIRGDRGKRRRFLG